jgi:hypothetical protein
MRYPRSNPDGTPMECVLHAVSSDVCGGFFVDAEQRGGRNGHNVQVNPRDTLKALEMGSSYFMSSILLTSSMRKRPTHTWWDGSASVKADLQIIRGNRG